MRLRSPSESSWRPCGCAAEASGGREAVELAIRYKPDIAVIAIALPILNGIELTRQIRRDSPATKVLILTMHGNES